MKKSLLDIVGEIEIEADDILKNAQERAEEELAEIKAAAQHEQMAVQEHAAQKSRSIIDEHVRAAEEEAARITEDAKRIVVTVQRSAKQNRERALLKARTLFNTLYGTSL